MKDRIPTYPGRVQLVPSPGGDNLFVMTRADEPTQAGTPLNKASLLSDATVAAIGLTGSDPTVNDALGFLASNYCRTFSGASAPGLDTPGKRGDIFVQDAGTGRRYVFVCDAVGEKPVDLDAVWERGSIKTGTATNEDGMNYRVRSDAVVIPKGTKLSIASGFKFGLRFMDADRNYTASKSLNTSSYTAEEDKLARILIARSTENTSETADITEFSAALSATANGTHWTALGAAREVEKEVIFTSSGVFTVPGDLHGNVTIRAFGGGAGGGTGTTPYGGGGGHMAVYTGPLTLKRYNVTIGKGGAAGSDGGATSFGALVTANGGSGSSGGTGGGGTQNGGNGSYGGGGGGSGGSGMGSGSGGNGGTYGGGGGGGGLAGGSGKNGAYAGGSSYNSAPTHYGGGGGGYTAAGSAATSSTGGSGGAGQNTNGFSLPFEGSGTKGTVAGGGGGFGGNGGNGAKITNSGLSTSTTAGGGGGGYGADGGNGSYYGGGGGGFGGKGGNGTSDGGGGGGGFGLSGNGGDAGKSGGTAAGGGAGAAGGDGVVVITYMGMEVV